MLQAVSDRIEYCYQRALDAEGNAAETADPRLKADFEALVQRWRQLAECYAHSECVKQYVLELDTKIAKRGEWRPVACAPFDRDLELSIIEGPTPHALAFPCCRILRGWVDAETRERIEVDPTHWREWI